MKRIPDLTDDQFAMICKALDITLRATGAEFAILAGQTLEALNKTMDASADIAPDDPS